MCVPTKEGKLWRKSSQPASQPASQRGNPTGSGLAHSSWASQRTEQNTSYAKMLGFLFSKLLCLEKMNEERCRSGQMVALQRFYAKRHYSVVESGLVSQVEETSFAI